MKNKTRSLLNSLFMIVALALIILGVAGEAYWISGLGLLLIIGMLIIRGSHINKLNREIREMKEIKEDETDHPENE